MPPGVAPPVVARSGGQGDAATPGQQGGQRQGSGILGTVARMAVFYLVMQYFKGNSSKQSDAPAVTPTYRKGDLLDLYVLISEDPNLEQSLRPEHVIWHEKDISLASGPERNFTYFYKPSLAVQNNGSAYLQAFFFRAGTALDVPLDDMSDDSYFIKTHMITKHMARPKKKAGVNLLGEDKSADKAVSDKEEQKTRPEEIVNFWKPNATITMVDCFQTFQPTQIPPQVRPHMSFDENGNYHPLVIFNDFWLLKDTMIMLNSSVEEVPLQITLKPLKFMWYQVQQQFESSFEMQRTTGLTQEGDSDEFKRIVLEGNPVLLCITFAVSLMHSIFDFFAFKNDIGFWKNNKSMEGLSARSVLINAACQIIIFFYLLDNETSTVVLLSSGVGALIELWKVTKAMDVTVDMSRFPFIKIKDRASYSDQGTKKYDAEAMQYLSYALYPLIIGYCLYSLKYEKHKSWYSWLLGSLVGAVYTFGFILMCPQLYLNYKLKSVAHLPWRQMTYKFLNTIIDDLFAFVIKMPLLHRLSVFRDDVIFLIYIYQRWIYRVDKTRVNEFGYAETKPDDVDALTEGNSTIDAAPADTIQQGAEVPPTAPEDKKTI